MKNPFEKNDHKVLIAGVVIGSVVVGTAAYLLLTETGATIRRELTGHLNRVRDVVMGADKDDVRFITDDDGRAPVAGPENV